MAKPLYFDLETIERGRYGLYAIGDDRRLHYGFAYADDMNFSDNIRFKQSHSPLIERTVNNEGFMRVKNGIVYFVMSVGLVGSTMYIMQKDEDNYLLTGKKEFDSRYTSYLEVDDRLILAGGDGGLAISYDTGNTWRYPRLSTQQPMPSITTITNDGVFLYMGINSDDGGFLISADDGLTWIQYYPDRRTNTLLPGRVKKIFSQTHEQLKFVYLVQDAGISFFVASIATGKILEWKAPWQVSIYESGTTGKELWDKDLIDGYAAEGIVTITAMRPNDQTSNIVKYYISPVLPPLTEPLTHDEYFNPNGHTKVMLRTTSPEAPGRAFVLDAVNVFSGGGTLQEAKWVTVDINKV